MAACTVSGPAMPLADCARRTMRVRALSCACAKLRMIVPSASEVVGGADFLDYVALASDVVASNPCPCHSGSSFAAFEPAVTDMQARLEQPIMWLAPAGETASAFSALEPCVGGPARHRSCPTNVQYTGKNTQRQVCTDMAIYSARSRPSETRRDAYGRFCVSLTAKTGVRVP